jgi:hypothetical protein
LNLLGIGLELAYQSSNNKMFMILQFFFRRLSIEKQVLYLKKKGVALGSRAKNSRKIYIYMLGDLFVEVMYKDDNMNDGPEKINMLRGLKNLNEYLENEFKASF